MGKLKDWADSNSQFITIEDGESLEIVYKGWKNVPNRFDTDKETIRYIFLVDGQEKYWENGSGRTARFFDEVKEGEPVKITRKGEGQKTQYELELLIK